MTKSFPCCRDRAQLLQAARVGIMWPWFARARSSRRTWTGQVFSSSGIVGNAATTDGLSVGGWGNGKNLFGEVQEVTIYQNVPPDPQAFIVQNMFSGQPTNDPSLSLKGYFPLAYSTTSSNQFRNLATAPVPTGSDSATPQGAGTVTFEESNEAGEQSGFDARKNGGRDALAPLSGGFSWQQTSLARPTPGIVLDFRVGYSSANVSGTYSLNGFDPYASGPMGKGWRHTFERASGSVLFSFGRRRHHRIDVLGRRARNLGP